MIESEGMQSVTTGYWLPPHVRPRPSASGTVLLDLRRNRYFGIGLHETQALSTLAQNWLDVVPADPAVRPLALAEAMHLAKGLVTAGLLSAEEPPANFLRPPCLDLDGVIRSIGYEDGLDQTSATPLHIRDVLAFVRACAWARRSVRSRSFYNIAAEINERKHRANTRFDEPRAIELVRVFRRLRPFMFAAKDRCLFHALALVRFLSYYEVFATWVIGVRLRPWAAHSWVQHDDLVLDASPEQIYEYTPILVV